MNNPNTEIIKFFVLQYSNRDIGVTANWNTETIKVGDLIKGKITVNTMTRSFRDFESVQLKYTVTNSDGSVLGEETINLSENTYQFHFQVPQTFQQYLIILIEITADVFNTTYKKEFSEAIYDDIVIDFNHAAGKVVENFLNKFYYQAFDDSSRIFTVAIDDANIISRIGNNVTLCLSLLRPMMKGRVLSLYIYQVMQSQVVLSFT